MTNSTARGHRETPTSTFLNFAELSEAVLALVGGVAPTDRVGVVRATAVAHDIARAAAEADSALNLVTVYDSKDRDWSPWLHRAVAKAIRGGGVRATGSAPGPFGTLAWLVPTANSRHSIDLNTRLSSDEEATCDHCRGVRPDGLITAMLVVPDPKGGCPTTLGLGLCVACARREEPLRGAIEEQA